MKTNQKKNEKVSKLLLSFVSFLSNQLLTTFLQMRVSAAATAAAAAAAVGGTFLRRRRKRYVSGLEMTTTMLCASRRCGSPPSTSSRRESKGTTRRTLQQQQQQHKFVKRFASSTPDATTKNEHAQKTKKKVLVISGPTSVGKSGVAISLAKRLNGEVISADSVQVYEHLNVGSAKLSREEMQSIRHHMLDLKSPITDDFDVAEFYQLANQCMDDIHERGKVPIVCGGTGMYLKWLTDGKPNVPKSTKESSLRAEKVVKEIRDRYNKNANDDNDGNSNDNNNSNIDEAWDEAIEYLKQRGDSETAAKLARNDWYRLTRALEILNVSGGKPKGSFQPIKDESRHFLCYALSMNRIDLYRRMDQRVEEMVANGILDEAAYLLREGVKPNTNSASRAIGYAHSIDYLLKCKNELVNNGAAINDAALLEFIDELQRETRMYAKRQFTWLRSEKQFRWIDTSEGIEKASARILETFNNDSNDKEEVNETNNNSSIAEVTKEMANELKRYRVELKLFDDENIRKATIERVADIISRI